MLRKNLGQATYRDLIRESLRPASTALAPLPYTYLWQLKIHGILNLNLDRLATKAFYQINNERTPTEFTGSQAASLTHVLKNPTPFIANLHGISDDADSWVFTKK
jgi:hypothetical protein